MKTSRQFRVVAALLALMSMLFMQLAMASYACPEIRLGQPGSEMAADMEDSAAEDIKLSSCHEMDKAQPNLCHAHAQSGNQSLDAPQVPQVAPFAAVAAALPVVLMATPSHSQTIPIPLALLGRTTSPPIAIRHCCFRN